MIGKHLSHYLIESEIGRGGMGIVYRAKDTKLDRTVAIKVLPAAALSSEDDRARFYREAKAAAALTHPHIAIIHGVDEAVVEDDKDAELRPFIAMEFIDGATLEDQVRGGPLKLEEAIRIASEVASALKMAHENDVVHRDVKSANVMIASDGRAKVLDFGLAQTAASTKLTRLGSTLGTVAYMSPEQARGEPVDARTDLYSIGVILYEMIAGRMPFLAEYEQAAIYSILNEDPEALTSIRSGVPMDLEAVVFKALRKDRETRYQSAGDLMADLKAIDLKSSVTLSPRTTTIQTGIVRPEVSSTSAAASSKNSGRAALMALAVAGMIMTFLVGWFLSGDSEATLPETAIRVTETIPGMIAGAVSPNGEHIMFVTEDTLWVRRLSAGTATAIATFEQSPRWEFWSYDSRRIGFVDGDLVRSIQIDGTNEIRIGRIPPSERLQGAVWTQEDSVLIGVAYGGANQEIVSFPASGGSYSSWMTLSASSGDFVVLDLILHEPSGQILAITDEARGRNSLQSSVRILRAEENGFTEADAALRAITLSDAGYARMSYDSNGHLFLTRDESLWIMDIDPETLMPLNSPRVFLSGIRTASLSATGLLVGELAMESADVDLISFNVTTGEVNMVTDLDRMSLYFAASPTGEKVVTVGWDGIQIIDLQRGDIRRISGEGANGIGDWLPSGAGILGSMYSGETGGADIYAFDPDGIDEPKIVIDREESAFYPTLSPDQSTLMWYETSQETGRDLWKAPAEIKNGEIRLTGEAELWYAGRNDDVHPDWHPSGNWILYAANHTGEYQVYLRAYPSARNERPVSLGTGFDPTWNEDGSAIYYRTGKYFMQVDVLNNEAMELSQPRELLDLQSNRIGVSGQLNRVYTVNPVTGELLFNQFRGAKKQPGLVYIQNWKALLE